ncbi:hypothetical protein [Roseinatronobacter sp. S2]|uniref:hypothetical protein n=1 Tax=Roseinatronobacter sp. S2 TaxID=3035471 RepID=UPI00240EF124|nr:hypothetical protein [Roseinatronobacter sp. S2]WFE73561.1 hypothetical protein P8S53_10205 [Roseinatronobacter sp. S2]
MRHDWLVAQLDAMKRYALQNHLSELADALQTAKLVALVEIASIEGKRPIPPQHDT